MCRKKTTPIVRAACATGWAFFLIAVSTQAQTLSKEYIRLGGRVVAIEAPVSAFTVTPDPPLTVPAPGNQLTFNSNLPANWSVTPPNAGFFSPASGTDVTLTVANPLPNGLLSLTVTATQQGGSASRNIVVPLMAPIVISGAATLSPGAQSQYSSNIPVTWDVNPGNLGTVSPASTAANAFTTVTVSNNPPGSPSGFGLIARDARATTDPRFQTNLGSRFIAIQYAPPSASGSYSVNYYNGTGAAAWTFGFTDPQGLQNIEWLTVHFSTVTVQSVPNSCALYVYPRYSGYTYLLNDPNNGVVAGNIGGSEPLRNSQCLIDLKGLRVYDQGGVRYLQVPALFSLPFLGLRDIYLSAGNNQGQMAPWLKVAAGLELSHSVPATSLLLYPQYPNFTVDQPFRYYAMSTQSGSYVSSINLSAKDWQWKSCEVSIWPGSNTAYLYSSDPSAWVSASLTDQAAVLDTPRCSIAMSSVRFTSYAQMTPTAPYAFMDATIRAGTPMRGLGHSMFGYINYFYGGSYWGNPTLYLGYWNVPGIF